MAVVLVNMRQMCLHDPGLMTPVFPRTNKIKRTLNPKWNEEFFFKVNPSKDKHLQLNVFDENRITRDDFLGKVELALDIVPEETPGLVREPKCFDLKPRSSRSKVKGELGNVKSRR